MGFSETVVVLAYFIVAYLLPVAIALGAWLAIILWLDSGLP